MSPCYLKLLLLGTLSLHEQNSKSRLLTSARKATCIQILSSLLLLHLVPRTTYPNGVKLVLTHRGAGPLPFIMERHRAVLTACPWKQRAPVRSHKAPIRRAESFCGGRKTAPPTVSPNKPFLLELLLFRSIITVTRKGIDTCLEIAPGESQLINPEGMAIELKASPLISLVLGAGSSEGLLAEDDC